jgi:hypothetical protein
MMANLVNYFTFSITQTLEVNRCFIFRTTQTANKYNWTTSKICALEKQWEQNNISTKPTLGTHHTGTMQRLAAHKKILCFNYPKKTDFCPAPTSSPKIG